MGYPARTLPLGAESIPQEGPKMSLEHALEEFRQLLDTSADLPIVKKQRRHRISAFLGAYAQVGTIRKACGIVGVDRKTVYNWLRGDVDGFKELFELANHSYRESLEDMARERLRNPTGNRGSDVLLISQLNAAWPEKYKHGTADREEVGRETLEVLKEMQRDWRKKLEAGTVEGELSDPTPTDGE